MPMNGKFLARPSTRAIARLVAVGAALIGSALLAIRISRVNALPAEWIATTAKYVGLIVSSILGVIGTATDTKVLTDDGRYRLRPVGWAVVISIVIALIIGALGQHFEDQQQARRESEQVARLQNISRLAHQSLKRFSGQVVVRIAMEFNMEQPLLLPLAKSIETALPAPLADVIETSMAPDAPALAMYGVDEVDAVGERIGEELSHIRCIVGIDERVPPHRKSEGLMGIWAMTATPRAVEVIEYHRKNRMIRAVLRMTVTSVQNLRMYSASDFSNRRIKVTVMDMEDNREPGRVEARELRDLLDGAPLEVSIFDGELQTLLAYAKLKQYGSEHENFAHRAYTGTTSSDGEEGLLGQSFVMIKSGKRRR